MNGVENEPGNDPWTQGENLVRTRLPPRAVVGQRIEDTVALVFVVEAYFVINKSVP